MNTPDSLTPSRRSFLKSSAATAAAVSVATHAHAQGSGKLKLGLVGCGGRGTGAANQALSADPEVELYAMADAFAPNLQNSLKNLSNNRPAEAINCPEERQFTGLDAFQKVLDSGVDVVVLATPPGFRPAQLRAAIEAGKHVFCEKPMAVDAAGARSVIATAKMAKEKNLNLVSGFCWRSSNSRREAFQQVLDGSIGDVTSIYATYYTGPVKPMPPADSRPAGMGDVEWQIRNWYNFSWLSGDSLVEQAVHSVDKIGWATGDRLAVSAVAVGGRQKPANGGNIYDHFSIVYQFDNGVRATMASRQIPGCFGENADFVTGTKGELTVGKGARPYIKGEKSWRFKGENNDMYQTEHDRLFAAIRSGETINEGEWMINSCLLAIMGRMAAYTGQMVTAEQMMNSKEDLAPDGLNFDDEFTPSPLPIPGQTKLI